MLDFWQRRSIGRNVAGIALLGTAWFVVANLLWLIATAFGLFDAFAKEVTWVALGLTTLMVARLFDGMPASFTGLDLRWGPRELLSGGMLGGMMAAGAWGIVALWGYAEGTPPTIEWGTQGLGVWLLVLAIDAAGEELLFRGYIFGRVVEIIGPVAATICSSLLFAVAHASNPSVSTIGLVNIFLGGTFFSLCYLRTGSLWVAIGAHAAWNIVLAKVLGVPVSGMEFGGSILRTPASGPEWLSGGMFGPEGGMTATLVLILGGVVLLTSSRFTPSPYAYASLFHAIAKRQRANPHTERVSESVSPTTRGPGAIRL